MYKPCNHLYVWEQEDVAVSCEVAEEAGSTEVSVDCSVISLVLPAHSQVSPITHR